MVGPFLLASALLAAQPAAEPANVERPRNELLAAARTIVAKDSIATLVTLDEDGAPRMRSVEVRPPDEDFVLWIATNPRTRKVAQIRANPKIALHFEVDEEGSYVSLLGTATLHDDEATLREISWRDPEERRAFWPDFPTDYLLIRVQPLWLEVIGEGIEADPVTWRPQAVVFD
jgi:general stress protein 26